MKQSQNDRIGELFKKLNSAPKVCTVFKLEQRIRRTNRKNEKYTNYISNKASFIPREGSHRT